MFLQIKKFQYTADFLKKWVINNKIESLLIVLIIFTAAFFRFYRISEYMTFLGDEGRDALMVKRILTTFDIPLIGPPMSVGDIYLGPMYYYMMALSMFIFWMDPVAAAGMVALIGTSTVVLIYYLAREWFGKKAAVVSSLLYASSPVTIIYSKSSWNPNPLPFFILLSLVGIYQVHKSGNFRWLILSGVSSAVSLQMHYTALIFIAIEVLIIGYELLKYMTKKGTYNHLFSGIFGGISAFFALMFPLIVFDIKHGFINYYGIKNLFFGSEGAIDFHMIENGKRIWNIYSVSLVGRYIAGENKVFSLLLSVAILLPIFITFWRKIFSKKSDWSVAVLGVWLILGITGLSFYQQSIFDHYLGFVNPAPYLLLGSLVYFLEFFLKKFQNTYLMIIYSLFLIPLLVINLYKTPLQYQPNNHLKRTQDIAQFVIEQSEGKPFNFALIAQNNYDAAYQFFLDMYGHKPEMVPDTITDQLFVVCEDTLCEPINHPKYEIAAFGWAKIEKEYEVEGVKIYKLVHNRPLLEDKN